MADSDARAAVSRGRWLQWFEEHDRRARYSLREQVRNAVIFGVLAIAAVRLIQTFTLSRQMPLACSVVGFVVGIALVGLAMVTFASWHVRVSAGHTSALVASMMVGAVSLAVLVEAFAGVSFVLWRQGLVPAPFVPGLWDSERHYLWHLLDSIPLLHIPQAVGLADRGLFGNHLGNVLLLGFKFALILPLARILVAGFRLSQTLRLARRSTFRHRVASASGPGVRDWLHRHRWHNTLRIVALTLAGCLVLYGVDAVLPGGAARPMPELSYAGDALIVSIALTAIAVARSGWAWPADRSAAVVAAVVRSAALIIITLTAGTAALLTLRLVGWAPSAGPPGGQLPATMRALVLQIVDVLPGPDIPVLLDWQESQDMSGLWPGLVVVLVRCLVLCGPFIVLASAMEGYTQRLSMRREESHRGRRLSVPRAFGRDLRRLHELLDQRDYAQTAGTPVIKVNAAVETLRRLRHESDTVRDTLGEIPGQLAKEAVTALGNRLFALRFRPAARTESESEALRNACVDRINAFGVATRAALRDALAEATPLVRRWPGVIAQGTGPDLQPRMLPTQAPRPAQAPPGVTGRQAGPPST